MLSLLKRARAARVRHRAAPALVTPLPLHRLERLEARLLFSATGMDAPAAPAFDSPVSATSINFDSYAIESFTKQDRNPVWSVLDEGATLALQGNAWKHIDFNYQVTSNTVLEFDFLSTSEGDIHGIALEDDTRVTKQRVFKLHGTERGKYAQAPAYTTQNQWVHYKLFVGQFAGDINSLVFVNDHDVRTPTGTSFFANVQLYELPDDPPPAPDAPVIDFDLYALSPWGRQDKRSTVSVLNGGSTVSIQGNGWQSIGYNYTITQHTVLEFDFRSVLEGDVHGIALENDDRVSPERIIQLHGNESGGYRDNVAEPYAGSEGQWKHYTIEVGQFLRGGINKLVFVNDHDTKNAFADGAFANLRLYEATPELPDLPPAQIDADATYPDASYSSLYGYGLVDAAAAVALARGLSNPLADVEDFGGSFDWNLNMINAPEAWAAGATGEGVIVAVIDTGVTYTHAEFTGRIWTNTAEIAGNGKDDDGNGFIDDVRGWDFVNDDNAPLDGNGHGTHVAGTIAAANNGAGATGVAFDSIIMPVRVLDGSGNGLLSDVVAGVRYAAENGAHVINLSLGSGVGARALDEAIAYAQSLGSVVVMASGNSGAAQPVFPAAYADDWGLAVGAVDAGGYLTYFSNRSGTTLMDYVVAPGASIYSTVSNGYAYYSGTSMAAPHVAAVAALIRGVNPFLTAAQIESIIVQTANSDGVKVA